MKTKKKFIALSIAALLMVTLGTSVSFAGKPEGKGGKVTVESATPNSVIQTKDEDVIIVGTGFDDGSSIKFLVTGTTDDSQIEVGPTQFISSTQLKVHIKTTGSTAVVDYDVEVQATSGRKGKGTTLFRVKSINPPNPAIAYTGGQEQQELFTMDADGDDLDRLAGGRNNDPQSISWLPDGSGVVWAQRRLKGRSEVNTIKYVDKDGLEVITLFTGDNEINPWIAEWDAVESSQSGCGTSDTLVYFIGRDMLLGGKPNIYVMNLNFPSVVRSVVTDPTIRFIGTAVSKDGELLATYRYNDGGHPSNLDSRLEIRDLCANNAPVLWSWTMEQLGLPIDDVGHRWIDTLDWSVDGRLAVTRSNEDVWLIDPFANVNAPIVTRLTGAGTGFGAERIEQSVAWSPQGDVVGFVSMTDYLDSHIYTVNVATGEVQLLGGKSPRVIDWRDNWQPDSISSK